MPSLKNCLFSSSTPFLTVFEFLLLSCMYSIYFHDVNAGAGNFLWPWNNQSWMQHWKDIDASWGKGGELKLQAQRTGNRSLRKQQLVGGNKSNRFQN